MRAVCPSLGKSYPAVAKTANGRFSEDESFGSKERVLQLVIFDVDGTLVDSQNFIVEAQRQAFLAHGLEPATRERALSIVGLSLREAFLEIGGPDAPVDSLAQAYRDFWSVNRHNPDYADVMFPGAVDMVQRLGKRDDILLGIATGKSLRGVTHLFDLHGWHDLFVTIQTSDNHPSKPAPSMILQALADTGIHPDRAIMVGDTSFDMAMARSAGVRGIGVSWGYHPNEELTGAGAERIIDHFDELLQVLDGALDGAKS